MSRTLMDGYRSVRDLTLDGLRRAIILGEFAPGQRLKEQDLAERFGVSTTPVKQALQRLETEGLVESSPMRGCRVSISLDSTIAETGLLRAALEGLAAQLAASKATDTQLGLLDRQLREMREKTLSGDLASASMANTRFHELIHEAAGNFTLQQMLTVVRTFGIAMREKTLLRPNEAEIGLDEHQGIYEAIAKRDGELSRKRMERHVLRAAQLSSDGEADE